MRKALIVDDELMIREGLLRIIPWQKLGIGQVFAAESGASALQVVKTESPDIMLTDISMTEMDGLSLIEAVRQTNANMCIIVLTGYDSFEYAQRCCKMQVQDFLLKPVDEEELCLIIKKQLTELEEDEIDQKKQKLLNRVQGIKQQTELERVMRALIRQEAVEQPSLEVLDSYRDLDERQMQVALLMPMLDLDNAWVGYNDLLHMSIKNLCISQFDYSGGGITFEDEMGQIIIVLFDDDRFDDINDRAQELKNLIADEYDVEQKIILGGVVKGIGALHFSYRDALALTPTAQDQYDTVIRPQTVEHRAKLFHDTLLELKKEMMSNIGDVDKLIRAFDAFEVCTESYNLSDSLVRRSCFEIAASLYLVYVSSLGESVGNQLNSLLNALLVGSREEYCRFTRDFLMQLFTSKSSETHEIIDHAKRYINDNLADDLSVSRIAGRLFITPNYFSRLFKKVTGKGCNEFIVQKRIEKARSLLETTNQKTGRIAGMVGYRDTNYFSLAFKKHTGMSPTEYRENARKTIL